VGADPHADAPSLRCSGVVDEDDKEVGTIIRSQLHSVSFRLGRYWSPHTLRSLFQVGARWQSASKDEIAYIRQTTVKLSNHDFVDVIKLFAEKALARGKFSWNSAVLQGSAHA